MSAIWRRAGQLLIQGMSTRDAFRIAREELEAPDGLSAADMDTARRLIDSVRSGTSARLRTLRDAELPSYGPPQTFPAGVRRHTPRVAGERPFCTYVDPDTLRRCDRDLVRRADGAWAHTTPPGAPHPRARLDRWRVRPD